MIANIEIKTVYMAAAEYIEKYRDIPYFLEFCKACPRYNKCWACPPYDFDIAALVRPFSHVYLIGAKIQIEAALRQIVKGREAVGEIAEEITKVARVKIDPIILSLEKTLGDALCCYGGTCYLCHTCQKEVGKPCIHVEKRRSSLEAMGFDVARTTQEVLDFALLWGEEELPPYITTVSALFTNKLADIHLVV